MHPVRDEQTSYLPVFTCQLHVFPLFEVIMRNKEDISFRKLFQANNIKEQKSEHILMGLRKHSGEEGSSTSSIGYDSRMTKSESVEKMAGRESLESIKLCQKLEAMDYKVIDDYAKLFVDEIIDISVGVCRRVRVVLDGLGKYEFQEGDDVDDLAIIKDEELKTSTKKDIFLGWPTIAQFSLDLAISRIYQFMILWSRKEAWKFSVFYIASWSDLVSDFHRFQLNEMYMSNRVSRDRKIRPSGRPQVMKRSLDDIDELTYMLMLGTRYGNRKSVASIASLMKKICGNWLPETDDLPEHVEAPHTKKEVDEKGEQVDSESGGSVEEQVSEVSIPDKIRCIKFSNVELFAEMFVDEIIDISVDVCENLFNAALGGEGEDRVVTEIPCICESYQPPAESAKASIADNTSLSSVEKEDFSGWPAIKHFTVNGAKKKITEFMGQWYFVEDWKYTVHYLASYSDTVSDYHLFQGMWSIPTKEYPIAQATASVFFTIEVSRVKPKFCLVNVTLQFEGSSNVYRAGQFEFIEQWLFNIIDSKLNLFRTLRF